MLSKLAEADDMAIKTEVGALLLMMVDGFEPTYFSARYVSREHGGRGRGRGQGGGDRDV